DVVISENMSDSGIKIDVGPIDAKSKYLLTLELSSADQLVGSLVLRRQGHPWTNISETYSFGIDASNQRVEKLFEFPEETEAGSILLTIENRHGAFTMENIVWAEVDVPLQTSPAHFYYNPTNNQKVVKLSGSYIDLEGQKAGSEFTLEPFSSKILLEDN